MTRRIVYLDWLRVFATIAVVGIHIAAGFVGTNLHDEPKSHWLSGNLFETLFRCSVPIFVMISGALLLRGNKAISNKEFLLKRASKVFIPLLGWSIIYYFYQIHQGYYVFSFTQPTKLFITQKISTHLWFMYMILGLYLITPLVRILIKNAQKRDIEYFLILWFFASVMQKFMNYFWGINLNLELYFVTNYVGFFILGYYLAFFEITKKWRLLSYIGALIGLVSTFTLTHWYTVKANGVLSEIWYEYHSPNVVLVAIGVFVFFKYALPEGKAKLPKVIEQISILSFGIYLIHILILQVFSNEIFDIIENSLHPIFSIPINIIITIMIGALVVYIMKKVPLIKKLVP